MINPTNDLPICRERVLHNRIVHINTSSEAATLLEMKVNFKSNRPPLNRIFYRCTGRTPTSTHSLGTEAREEKCKEWFIPKRYFTLQLPLPSARLRDREL